MNLYDSKILLVDDEPALQQMVAEILNKAGFDCVTVCGNLNAAWEAVQKEMPSLILLDVMLPDGDGFSFMEKLRKESTVPVIFLSARDEDEDRLHGLGLGADDYIVKPFLPQELILRIKAVLGRVYRIEERPQTSEIVLGNCRIDFESGVAYWKEKETALTAKEYAILKKLAANRGKIVTIDALCESVWQEGNFGYENTLIVHIRRLREKIEEQPSQPKYLLTVRGLGYKLI